MGHLPTDAFTAGTDENGSRLFVARANHNGGIHPCKFHEGHKYRAAQLSWGGGEHLKFEYEILRSNKGLYWKSMRIGQIHLSEDAVSTGEENGAPMYSVRGTVFGKMTIGKYSSQHKTAYFLYNGEEHEVKHRFVEVLCLNKNLLMMDLNVRRVMNRYSNTCE